MTMVWKSHIQSYTEQKVARLTLCGIYNYYHPRFLKASSGLSHLLAAWKCRY